MDYDDIKNYLDQNYEVYDRFTFDRVFRFLLNACYEREEAKDIIIYNCALSTLVTQERIDNEYYLKISEDDEMSDDLKELKYEIFIKQHFNRN